MTMYNSAPKVGPMSLEKEKIIDRNKFHSTILKFANFNKLLRYLENSMVTNLPNVEYPSSQLMEKLLQLTSLGPECTPEILQIDDKGYGNRGLNLRSLDLLHKLMQCIEEDQKLYSEDVKLSSLLGENSWVTRTPPNDVENISSNINDMLKFLRVESPRGPATPRVPNMIYEIANSGMDETETDDSDIEPSSKRRKRNTPEANLDIVNSSPEKSTKTLFLAGKDVFEEKRLLGNLRFNDMKHSMWDYFRWGFKCASLSLSDYTYLRSWNYWRTILTLFMSVLLRDFENCLSKSRSDLNSNCLKNTIFYKHANKLNAFKFRLGSLYLIEIALSSDSDPTLTSAQAIFDNDLRAVPSYVPLKDDSESAKFDSKLRIDSIQLRKTLLYMEYHLIESLNSGLSALDEYTFEIGKKLVKLPYADFMEFYTVYDAESSKNERPFLLRVSFACSQLLTSMIEEFHSSGDTVTDSAIFRRDVLEFIEEASVNEFGEASVYIEETKKIDLIINYWISMWGSNRTPEEYLSGISNIIKSVKIGESRRMVSFKNLFPHYTPSQADLNATKLSVLLEKKRTIVENSIYH